MNRSTFFFLLGSALALGALVACSSSTTPGSTTQDFTGSCQELASRCHSQASTLGKECHDLGHDGDDSKCGPREAECLAECPEKPATDGGLGGDAHAEEAGDAASVDPTCRALCTCLAGSCGSKTGYPYPDDAACLAACGALDAPSKACFPKWCAKAEAAGASSNVHFCEHAWGKNGTDECDTL